MSILKKVFNAVRKIFTGRSGRRKKAGKKNLKIFRKKKKITPFRKRTITPKKRKPKKKISSPTRNLKKKAAPKTTPASKTKNLSVVKESKPFGLLVGEVTHYFDRIKVCVIRIDQGIIKKGDRLLIKGNKSQLAQKVVSMQIESKDVNSARKGQLIGLKVNKPVFAGDEVFKAQ